MTPNTKNRMLNLMPDSIPHVAFGGPKIANAVLGLGAIALPFLAFVLRYVSRHIVYTFECPQLPTKPNALGYFQGFTICFLTRAIARLPLRTAVAIARRSCLLRPIGSCSGCSSLCRTALRTCDKVSSRPRCCLVTWPPFPIPSATWPARARRPWRYGARRPCPPSRGLPGA